MSIEVESQGRVKHVYRRRKMTIIEEEEEIFTTEIHNVPFENVVSKFDVQAVPVSDDDVSVGLDSQTNGILDDFEERKELAKIIGLLAIPKKTPDAIDQIFGIFDDIIMENQPDVVKLIKALRKRG